MPLDKLLQRLYQVNLFNKKSGLETMQSLCTLFQHPEKAFRSIHVAGTNGKGSVCTKTALGLQTKYRKVGLYTSPHLFRFNERIQINGQPISDADLERILAHTLEQVGAATFFEITTLVAFQYFAEQKVDIAVIETGIGGRFDATNVITPELSVITSISLEHTEILGNDILSIAKEKAGIIKPNIPAIIGPTVPREATSSPLVTQINGSFDLFEEENNAITAEILKRFGISFVPEQNPRCRIEMHQCGVPVIFDVAHNPDGLKGLFQALEKKLHQTRFHIVCGFSSTKDLRGCFDELIPHASHITLTESPNGRLASVDTLKQFIPDTIPYSLQINPRLATQEALNRAIQQKEPLLICGSFYIMEGAMAHVSQSK